MMILGADAKNIDREEKWRLLSPHFLKHGTEALAYATLQQGMEYFVHDLGYIAFTSVTALGLVAWSLTGPTESRTPSSAGATRRARPAAPVPCPGSAIANLLACHIFAGGAAAKFAVEQGSASAASTWMR